MFLPPVQSGPLTWQLFDGKLHASDFSLQALQQPVLGKENLSKPHVKMQHSEVFDLNSGNIHVKQTVGGF